MKKNVLLIAAASLLVISILTTGCLREAAPDVTPTPAAGVQAATPGVEMPVGMPDATAQAGTAVANATLAAQLVEPTETPTPTPEPTMTETPIPPTPEPYTPEPVIMPAPTTAPAGQITYVVQRGDTLFSLARRYGTTVEAIASANNIANPNQIRAGQVLVIPTSGIQPIPQPGGETTYVVRPGDNLFRIALRYGLSYTYLAQYNGIPNPALIRVGQVLRIPPR